MVRSKGTIARPKRKFTKAEKQRFTPQERRTTFQASSIGGGGGRPHVFEPSPSFGVQTPEGIRISTERGIGAGNTIFGTGTNELSVPHTAQPIGVPRVSGTRTRREIQLSEGKKGDLFCEIKIIKGKRKRVCKVKTTDKKRKKPIRVTRSVDKQFGFFRRIL